MKTTIQEVLEIKATMMEIAKDTPLFAYMAFYEPLHNWVSGIAEGWNPFAKFVLNIVMVVYGILRIIALIRGWNKTEQNHESLAD
jgi:hypothetical protein